MSLTLQKPYYFFLLKIGLILAIGVTLCSISVLAQVEDLQDEQHNYVTKLTDNNFDAHVFPQEPRSQSQSWFIFFYAPWCGHCKNLLPQFDNASRLLDESSFSHAKFGVVNAVTNKALASRFAIEAYPTLIYTTGKTSLWYKFHGGYGIDSFLQFAVYLQRGVDAGSFADIVSDPRYFSQVEREMALERVPIFVYVPPTSQQKQQEQREEANQDAQKLLQQKQQQRRIQSREALWNIAVDAAASMGNVRFGVIYGDDIPTNWAEQGSGTYISVIEAAQHCPGTGPGGEVLLVFSDAYRKPLCYTEGPWLRESNTNNNNNNNNNKEVSTLTELHPTLASFITRNGFRAVEEMSPGLFSVLSGYNHHYVGLLLTDGPLTQTDNTMLPVLREVVQTRNSIRGTVPSDIISSKTNRRISLAHADGRTQALWRMRYHVEKDELPAFFVVDPRRDKVYRLRTHFPRFEEIKKIIPWQLGGEQQELIMTFLSDVEKGQVSGEKMSVIGDVAEFLLRFPGMEFIYETLGYEDGLFITMVFAFAFFSFLLFLALVVEPMMERRMAVHAKTD